MYFTRDARARDGRQVAKCGQQLYLCAALGLDPESRDVGPIQLKGALQQATRAGWKGPQLKLGAIAAAKLLRLVARAYEPV
eukprot:2217770-Prymnesium_polylepis.1